jgi:hypothetical protein
MKLLNKRILLDINVILDVLLKRKDLYKAPALIFKAVENNKIEGFICALSFPTLFYLLSKELDKITALNILSKIRIIFKVSNVDEQIVDKSLISGFKDFEDAIQHYSALSRNLDYLITRNIKDYKLATIPIISPEEFIALDIDLFK